jgi:hypothetical protein
MKVAIRIIIKLVFSTLILIFFGGVFRGCSEGAQSPFAQGLGILFATIIFLGSMYGIWVYSPKKKSSNNNDITLKKD